MTTPRALIADDEPHLAADLERRLRRLWPALEIVAVAHSGTHALDVLQTERPPIAFLDIRMPGLSGLAVAERLTHACQIVFVTAYDEYAVDAFEREAVDYLLKPIDDARLARTVERLQRALQTPAPESALADVLKRLDTALSAPRHGSAPLRWLRASAGERIRLVAVNEVDYFQARDKYTSVLTPDAEYVIRTPIRELAQQLDSDQFWQVHRGTIVNIARVASVEREFGGRLTLRLRGRDDTLRVSRAYAGRFEQM
jgi:DNA-binding LytR/AlgR family response regulator